MSPFPLLLFIFYITFPPTIFTQPTTSTLPLCIRLSTTPLPAISIQSITYLNPQHLLIFSDGFKYIGTLAPWLTTVTLSTEVTRWNVGAPVQQFSAGNLSAVYYFHNNGQVGLLVITSGQGTCMWNARRPMRPVLAWKESATSSVRPEFSIIHDQDDDRVHGYVINRDIYTERPFFVIYQLWLTSSLSLTTHRLTADQMTRNTARYFYLARSLTGNTSEALLVHRSNLNITYQSLFSSLPVGFFHSPDLYLLDSTTRCVLILHLGDYIDLFELFGQSKSNLVLSRQNIPYEKFFDCPGERHFSISFPPEPNRCDVELPLGDSQFQQKDLIVLAVGTALLAFIVLAIVICFYFRARAYKREHTFKPSQCSNLAIDNHGLEILSIEPEENFYPQMTTYKMTTLSTFTRTNGDLKSEVVAKE